jgi:hypothetical protein
VKRLFLLSLLASLSAAAVEPPLPKSFRGDWVPIKQSCASKVRLRVEAMTVSLISGAETRQFGDLDICRSCKGGAHYGGIEVWLIPEFNRGREQSPFTVYFNHGEKKGVAMLEFSDKELMARFQLHKRQLRKCN